MATKSGSGGRDGTGSSESRPVDPDAWIPDEFEFLKKREGPPSSREVLALLQTQFRDTLKAHEKQAGVSVHSIGTTLIRLYDGQPERVYGGGSFTAWATAQFGLGREDVRRYLRIAAAFSEAQCADIGLTVLDLGVDIMEAKRWKTSDPLFSTQFDIGLEEKVTFPNKREVVRQILAQLHRKPVVEAEPNVPLEERVARLNRRWKLKQADNEVLATIKGRYQRKGDEIVFNAGALTAVQRREYALYVIETEQPSRRR